MVEKSATSNFDVLSFFEEPELSSLDLTMPNFTVVNHSHFTDIVVNLKELNYLALQVKIIKSFDFLSVL